LGTGLVEKHSDADPRVLDAYHLQSLGEAQEGLSLNHKHFSASFYCQPLLTVNTSSN